MKPEEHPTSNIQRRTSNGSANPRSLRRSEFDVGCSMFSLGSGGGRRPGEGRFMESEHLQKLDVNRSHEPTPNPSGGGESMSRHACRVPSWEGSGVGRFMGREHLQNSDVNRSHEPTPNPSGGGESMSRHA